MRKPVLGVSNQVRHKPGCLTIERRSRGLKLGIYEVEGLYYPCSENNADQLYMSAPLLLQKYVFLQSNSFCPVLKEVPTSRPRKDYSGIYIG